MKFLTTAILALTFATSAQATIGAWVEEGTHNTGIVQTNDLFGPSQDVLYRIKGPAYYGYCDKGASLAVDKFIPMMKFKNELTYFVMLDSKPFGDSGKCKGDEPVPPIAGETMSHTPWLKAKAGTTLLLILPAGYSLEIKK